MAAEEKVVKDADLSAKQILEKNEDNQMYSDIVAEATLETSGGKRKPAKKQFNWWRKLKSDKKSHDILTRFNEPAEIRNESILILEKPGEDNEVFIYLPKFKKIRRVESRSQNSSFMGSDFSYSDVSSVHVDDYDLKREKDDKCPFEKDKSCFQLMATPKTDSVRLRTGYKRLQIWIREKTFSTDRIHYFDMEDKLLKRLDSGDTKLLDEANKRYFSHLMIMNHLPSGQKTEMHFSKVKFNTGLKDKMFTKQSMENEGL